MGQSSVLIRLYVFGGFKTGQALYENRTLSISDSCRLGVLLAPAQSDTVLKSLLQIPCNVHWESQLPSSHRGKAYRQHFFLFLHTAFNILYLVLMCCVY
jgi:hypothetical protein